MGRRRPRMDRWAAADLLREAILDRFGSVEAGAAAGLKLRHDGGSCFRSGALPGRDRPPRHRPLTRFVYEPETNGVVEKFLQTLKEQVLWIERFDTLEQLRARVRQFARDYNEHWLLERHGYRSPAKPAPPSPLRRRPGMIPPTSQRGVRRTGGGAAPSRASMLIELLVVNPGHRHPRGRTAGLPLPTIQGPERLGEVRRAQSWSPRSRPASSRRSARSPAPRTADANHWFEITPHGGRRRSQGLLGARCRRLPGRRQLVTLGSRPDIRPGTSSRR